MNAADDRGFRPTIARLGPPGMAAAALITIAAVIGVAMLPGVVGAIFTPTPSPISLPQDPTQDQAARLAAMRGQIDGRTMFFVPAKPPPPPVVEVKHDNDGPPPAPPAPSTYGGPAPIAMVFDTVWFADGQKVKAGGEAKGDLQVVRLEAPWAAVLKWKGVEFTVKVFEKDSVVLKAPGQKMAEGTPPEPKPVPPPEPAPATAAAPPAATGDQPATPPADTSGKPPEPPADPEGNP